MPFSVSEGFGFTALDFAFAGFYRALNPKNSKPLLLGSYGAWAWSVWDLDFGCRDFSA